MTAEENLHADPNPYHPCVSRMAGWRETVETTLPEISGSTGPHPFVYRMNQYANTIQHNTISYDIIMY